MALNQTKTIQLLRSSALYTPTAAGEGVSAKTALENAKAALIALPGRKDGEIVLARYKETGGEIKSLLGIYHANPELTGNDVTAGWTFLQDITSSSDGLAALQAELDATQAGAGLNTDGSYIQTQNSNALEIIGVEGSAATSLMSAIEKIAAHIGGLDKAADAQNGQVVTTVTQTNGAVTETKANVKDLQLGGYTKDTSATGAIASTDTVNAALSKLENTIAANAVHSNDQSITVTAEANNGGTNIEVAIDATTIVKDSTSHYLKGNYTLHKLDSSELAALSDNNVKEAYRLQTIGGSTAIGDVVKVYKDSSLKEVYLGASTDTIDASTGTITKNTVADPQSMNFAYQLADGTYQLVKIDVSKFLTQSEFADGLQMTGGVVSVLIDSTSGKVRTGATPSGVTPGSAGDSGLVDVLTVSSNGVKVDNIQAAIDYATTNLAVTAAGDSVYISAAQDANDNKKINVTGTYGSFNTPTAQSNTLSATTNGIAKAEDVATAVNTVISNLDGNATATAASGDVYTVLTSVTETDGVISKGGEVTLAAVAKTGAAADVSVTDTAGKLTATNVEDALAEIVDKADASLNSVSSANGAIAVAGKDSNKNQELTFQVSASCAKQGDGTTNMLTIANDGLVLSNTWDCGTF